MVRLLVTASLAFLLCACAQPSKVIDRVVRVTPPSELLADCPAPVGNAKTNEDVADWLLAYKGALRTCNVDKQALRDWVQP